LIHWPLYVATLLYLGQSVMFALSRNHGMAVTFFAYALANVGIIYATR